VPAFIEDTTVSAKPEPLLNVDQVAELLNVSAQFVRDHATRCEPRIPCVRLGSLLRFRMVDIDEFIEAQLQAPPFRRRRRR
jgi:excisionase family DNA binding protein